MYSVFIEDIKMTRMKKIWTQELTDNNKSEQIGKFHDAKLIWKLEIM